MAFNNQDRSKNYDSSRSRGYGSGGNRDRGSVYQVNEEALKKIILNNDLGEMNRYCEELARYFAPKYKHDKDALSTSQVRTILDELQRMDNGHPEKLNLLKLKLAYTAGRHGGRVKDLYHVMDKAIALTLQGNTPDHMERLKYFLEAIVAYHRFHGGHE